MKLVKTIMLLGGLCILTACPHQSDDPDCFIINNSDIDITMYMEEPDADTFSCGRDGTVDIASFYVRHNQTRMYDGVGVGVRAMIRGYGGSISLLVVNARIRDEYRETPCDTFRKYVPILHRYQFTIEDMERMNWTIVYPPEEE
jgi:hypothetical protein